MTGTSVESAVVIGYLLGVCQGVNLVVNRSEEQSTANLEHFQSTLCAACSKSLDEVRDAVGAGIAAANRESRRKAN